MTDLSVGRLARLELFPAVHQIAHFPHERLMAVDHRLRRLPVFIEPGRRHRLLDVLDRVLAGRNLGLELFDSRPPRLLSLLRLASLGVGSLLIGVITLRDSGLGVRGSGSGDGRP